jgi:hypothetical protein
MYAHHAYIQLTRSLCNLMGQREGKKNETDYPCPSAPHASKPCTVMEWDRLTGAAIVRLLRCSCVFQTSDYHEFADVECDMDYMKMPTSMPTSAYREFVLNPNNCETTTCWGYERHLGSGCTRAKRGSQLYTFSTSPCSLSVTVQGSWINGHQELRVSRSFMKSCHECT